MSLAPWVSHEIVASIPKVEHALIVNMAFPGVVLSRTHHQRRRITYRLAKDNSFARLCCLFVLSVWACCYLLNVGHLMWCVCVCVCVSESRSKRHTIYDMQHTMYDMYDTPHLPSSPLLPTHSLSMSGGPQSHSKVLCLPPFTTPLIPRMSGEETPILCPSQKKREK